MSREVSKQLGTNAHELPMVMPHWAKDDAALAQGAYGSARREHEEHEGQSAHHSTDTYGTKRVSWTKRPETGSRVGQDIPVWIAAIRRRRRNWRLIGGRFRGEDPSETCLISVMVWMLAKIKELHSQFEARVKGLRLAGAPCLDPIFSRAWAGFDGSPVSLVCQSGRGEREPYCQTVRDKPEQGHAARSQRSTATNSVFWRRLIRRAKVIR